MSKAYWDYVYDMYMICMYIYICIFIGFLDGGGDWDEFADAEILYKLPFTN